MSRTKKIRFNQIKEFSNVFEAGTELDWAAEIFKNQNPVNLELGCGKAKFSLQMAKAFPDQNFVAIDRKGERIWRAAVDAKNLNLTNLAFVQGNIYYIEKDFLPHSINQIWLTFPDPLPKPNNANKRLSHQKFLKFYQKLLTPTGTFHLKTDSLNLINFTELEIPKIKGKVTIKELDIYNNKNSLPEHIFFQTDFEKKYLAKNFPIYYLEAQLLADQ